MSSLFQKEKFSARKIINDAVSRNSSRVGVRVHLQKLQKPKKTIKKFGIFGPHHDCLGCGGIGCGHCK